MPQNAHVRLVKINILVARLALSSIFVSIKIFFYSSFPIQTMVLDLKINKHIKSRLPEVKVKFNENIFWL